MPEFPPSINYTPLVLPDHVRPGREVYYLELGHVKTSEIYSIVIRLTKSHAKIDVTLEEGTIARPHNLLFATKQALLDSL